MSEWTESTLDEEYDFKSGLSKSRDQFGFGDGFVSFKDVFYNFFLPRELGELANTNAKEQESCSVKRGDVFLTRTSETFNELGMSSVALKDYNKATFNGFTKRLRPKPNSKIWPEYIGYYFRSSYFRSLVTSMATMTTRASLNNEILSKLKVKYPPLREQKAIAHILGTLDNKIELNRQMNQTLEAMAQALFKSWFVDFDPVMDNALAAGTEIPDELQAMAEKRQLVPDSKKLISTNPELATQFPSSFVYNETLGKWIPEGWEVKTIGKLSAVISKGTTPRKDDVIGLEESIPFIKVRDLDEDGNLSHALDLIPEQIHKKQLKRSILEKGDLLFSIAGTIGRVAVLPSRLHNSNCNQAVAFIRLTDKKQHNILVHQFLRSDLIQGEIHSKVVQAVQANTSLKNLSDLKVVLSDKVTMESFNNAMHEFYNRTALNKEQIESLTQLRDRLLPELISGRSKVTEGLFNTD